LLECVLAELTVRMKLITMLSAKTDDECDRQTEIRTVKSALAIARYKKN